MALDFSISQNVRPALDPFAADAFYGAPVDYCYQNLEADEPSGDHYNVPTLPDWAEVQACYSFESDSRPGIVHVAVTFCDPAQCAGKSWTICGCDAAKHDRVCWHLAACAELEQVALVDEGPVDFDEPAPFKPGDAVVYTSPRNGARTANGRVLWVNGDQACVQTVTGRAMFAVAGLTPAESRAAA